ncbi:hypothetical protein RND71_044090 [Anisodus tanguticus]|uniref:S-adenosylmethionine synthase n=1 Tax=Anisodus tanguticus TaxID=243964 RepID=A0AAE1QNN8_9SOLA|nr:hypothetical protein RND71_044090 [Anisodus tanguticus]
MNRLRIVVCLEDSIYIHQIKDFSVVHVIKDTPANKNGLIALSYEGSNFYLAYPGEVVIFDVITYKNKTVIAAHDNPLAAIAFNSLDKLCDQVSDAILDAVLESDPVARVACETAVKSGMIMIFGEISSSSEDRDYEEIVRRTIKNIGYDDISKDETEECMPLTITLAHKLNVKLSELRRNGEFPWARPDSKTQVTCEYFNENGIVRPTRVHTVVVSIQHSKDISLADLRKEVLEKVICKVIPEKYLDEDTIYHINPCGTFTIGGPMCDAGLTGRKIIVDTYGGWGAHGGGAFSGKDSTKVDRSGAYAARWVAKSLVKANLCKRCLIQISYAIGIAEPISITVFSYGTGSKSDEELLEIIKKNFDLRPGKIIQ